ncbi:hypothetical protein HZB02_01150 [Candidatus Woesearchaeota archaeon]|nr:hypothetical protein [Candidatus Woesearchaeota archaeon]
MNQILLVKLVIPDNVAITTLHTLQHIGFAVETVKRQDVFFFDISQQSNHFTEHIAKVDVLVNANKHRSQVVDRIAPVPGEVQILVKNRDEDTSSLLRLLHQLGFPEIAHVEKGTLWSLVMKDQHPDAIAQKIAAELLANEHYQDWEIVR